MASRKRVIFNEVSWNLVVKTFEKVAVLAISCFYEAVL